MIDIAVQLRSFLARRQGWDESQSVRIVTLLASRLGGRLEWDRDAGEDWARISPGESSVVLVYMNGPLLLVTEDIADRLRDMASGLPLVEVPAFNAVVLTCDPHVLRDAFGDRTWRNRALDPDHFSAQDLWFCTV